MKRKMNPRAHSIGGSHLIVPPCRVASQLKTLIPGIGVGIGLGLLLQLGRRMWC